MRRPLAFCAILALAACSQEGDQASTGSVASEPAMESPPSPAPAGPRNSGPIAPIKTDAPSGTYRLDPSHASLTFRVNHLGFSNYTARFTRFDAELQLDTASPATSRVAATIDPNSLELPAPPPGFTEQLRGPQWLDTAQFPEMRFRSTEVVLTSPNTARVTGDFTLHGQTRGVSMDVTFNGGYPGMAMDPNARIGISAHGTFKRSEFGIALGVPAPGSTMGVGDDVEIIIDAEFTGPPLAEAVPAPTPAP